MKRGIFLFLVCILFLQLVSADTTFFEGDLGYREDFIMAPISEAGGVVLCGDNSCNSGENCEICPKDCGACTSGSSGINREPVCDVIFNSLKEHIRRYQDIDYNENELESLQIQLKEELNSYLRNNQVEALVENFDDECGRPYPILSGFVTGRFRTFFTPLRIIISFTLLISLIFLYWMLRKSRKNKFKKRIKRRKKK